VTLREVICFLVGALAGVAATLLLHPWLRERAGAWWATFRTRALAFAGLALVVTVLLYGLLRTLHPLSSTVPAPSAADAIAAHVNANPQSADSMQNAVAALENRLARGGGSDADWELLARSYEFMGRPADAVAARARRLPQGAAAAVAPGGGPFTAAPGATRDANVSGALSAAARELIASAEAARRRHDLAAAAADYRQLAARQEMTADAWADYADVAAGLHGNSLVGEPEKYLQNALRLDPQHPKALWLEGSLQHETGQYAQAVTTWQVLAGVLGPDSPDAKIIAANLAEDQRLAGPAAAPPATEAGGVAVTGEVLISDALRPRVPSGLTLFIVAKSLNSPGPPVAILRTTTGSWPVRFELNDSLAMIPSRKLSTAGTVTIEARVSKSGQAMPQSGDLLGVTAPLDPAAGKPVRIVIERVIGS
jgi:cytochrome c-type biogenesis protein CcmH/NrfG